MNKHTIMLLAALTASTAACNNAPPEPEAPPAPNPVAATPEDSKPELNAEDLEHSYGADAQAPFVLTLDGPESLPEGGGLVTLVAKLDAPHKIDAPTTITITLPPGAKLQKGEVSEQWAAMPKGVTERRFEVVVPAQLDPDQPIQVEVHMQHPSNKFGAHAKRTYPEVAKSTPTVNARVPGPPVGRPVGGGVKAPQRSKGAPSMPGTR